MRRNVALLCVSFVLAGACSQSRVARDAVVHIDGTVVGADLTPLHGARVALVQQPDAVAAVFGSAFVIGSAGTVCLLAHPPPGACGHTRTAKTDSHGRFRFTLRGGDTQGVLGSASTMMVVVAPPGTPPPAAPLTSVAFRVRRTDVTLPQLALWPATPAVTAAVGGVRVSWPALPRDIAAASGHRVDFFDAAGIVWSQPAASPALVDDRLLEDTSGSVVVDATSSVTSRSTDFAVTYRTAAAPYAASAGPPPSRRRPCVWPTGAGTEVESRCPLTDGDFAHAAGPPRGSHAGAHPSVMIDLGHVQRVDLVVVRGCPATCLVETSQDARTWTYAATIVGRAPVARRSDGRPARYVRVRSPAGLDITPIGEVSVW